MFKPNAKVPIHKKDYTKHLNLAFLKVFPIVLVTNNILLTFKVKKSSIRETPTLSTDATGALFFYFFWGEVA